MVLLVEDDEAVVDATTMLLESAGMRVHWACDGASALDGVSNGLQPDLVICDYRLPVMTGVEVVRHLRRMLAIPVPAVLMTGDTSSVVIDFQELPDCSVFHKPVDTSRLLDHIEASLGASPHRSSA